MELILTNEERELLMEVLEESQRELLREISRANHREFKIALKNKEKLLESLICKMRVVAPGELAAHLV